MDSDALSRYLIVNVYIWCLESTDATGAKRNDPNPPRITHQQYMRKP